MEEIELDIGNKDDPRRLTVAEVDGLSSREVIDRVMYSKVKTRDALKDKVSIEKFIYDILTEINTH